MLWCYIFSILWLLFLSQEELQTLYSFMLITFPMFQLSSIYAYLYLILGISFECIPWRAKSHEKVTTIVHDPSIHAKCSNLKWHRFQNLSEDLYRDEEPCHLDFCRQCHDICKCRCFRVNSPLVTVIKNMWAINALSSFDGNAFRQVFSVHTWHRRSRVIKCSYSSRNRMFSPLWDIVPLSIITIAFPWTDCWCSYWLTRCHCRTDIDLSISKMSR